ncbi:hypothetical protein MTR67_017394 [Solanum verrucosum]|uniref:Uncharacterized protein n=1 Tax=Solanum verrucosum TaxID=315347 RepID=A0AAF0TLS6_SOLVR|nr:hypothetical protein MTR67_017394 [Solanum verrucosum]
MTTQENREVVSPMNPNVGTTATRVRGFTRMNPLEFLKSKVEEDPQEFIDEEERAVVAGPLDWEKFKVAFLNLFCNTSDPRR